MANETLYSETTTREEPYLEAMRRGLLQDVRGLQANRFGYNLVDQTDPETGEVLRDEFGYPHSRISRTIGRMMVNAFRPRL